jgi:hypothetical protein
MKHVWKQLHTIRALTVNGIPSTPHHLRIKAWGREFRVVPSAALRASTKTSECDVSVDVVGPLVPGSSEPRLPHASFELGVEATRDYAAFSYKDDDITAVTAVTGASSEEPTDTSCAGDGDGR